MPFLDEVSGAALVATVTGHDCNDTSDHTIFTVPAGKSFIPTLLIMHSPSANMTSYVFSAGLSSAKTDFVVTITASGVTGATKLLVIRPNYNATPAAGSGLMTIIPAGGTFVIDNLTAAGVACTCTVELYGFLF